MKILLIEDEIKIAEFTILGLTSAGFKVTHVSNGAAGLAAMLERHAKTLRKTGTVFWDAHFKIVRM